MWVSQGGTLLSVVSGSLCPPGSTRGGSSIRLSSGSYASEQHSPLPQGEVALGSITENAAPRPATYSFPLTPKRQKGEAPSYHRQV